MRQLSRMMQMNIHPTIGWRRDEHGIHNRTRLVDSLICITRSIENNAFSVLHDVLNVAFKLGRLVYLSLQGMQSLFDV